MNNYSEDELTAYKNRHAMPSEALLNEVYSHFDKLPLPEDITGPLIANIKGIITMLKMWMNDNMGRELDDEEVLRNSGFLGIVLMLGHELGKKGVKLE